MHTPRQKLQYEVDNKIGAYGEAHLDRRVIKINRRRHKSKKVPRISRKPDGNEHLGKTIYHEELHHKYPKAKEKTIRRMEKGWSKLTVKQKNRRYAKIKNK